MSDKILPEELHFLENIKKDHSISVMKTENLKLQYENTLLKIMKKYKLTDSDSIDESTGAIVRRSPPPTASSPMTQPAAPVPSEAAQPAASSETTTALAVSDKSHGSFVADAEVDRSGKATEKSKRKNSK